MSASDAGTVGDEREDIIVTFACPSCGCTMSLDEISSIPADGRDAKDGSASEPMMFELWCGGGCGFVYTEKACGSKAPYELRLVGFLSRAREHARQIEMEEEHGC